MVSALVWGTRGRGFKSRQPDHEQDLVRCARDTGANHQAEGVRARHQTVGVPGSVISLATSKPERAYQETFSFFWVSGIDGDSLASTLLQDRSEECRTETASLHRGIGGQECQVPVWLPRVASFDLHEETECLLRFRMRPRRGGARRV